MILMPVPHHRYPDMLALINEGVRQKERDVQNLALALHAADEACTREQVSDTERADIQALIRRLHVSPRYFLDIEALVDKAGRRLSATIMKPPKVDPDDAFERICLEVMDRHKDGASSVDIHSNVYTLLWDGWGSITVVKPSFRKIKVVFAGFGEEAIRLWPGWAEVNRGPSRADKRAHRRRWTNRFRIDRGMNSHTYVVHRPEDVEFLIEEIGDLLLHRPQRLAMSGPPVPLFF